MRKKDDIERGCDGSEMKDCNARDGSEERDTIKKESIQKSDDIQIKVKKRNTTKKESDAEFKKLIIKTCIELKIPQKSSILKDSMKFFNERISKLEFLNEQMMEIYSRAFLFVINQNSCIKSKFIGKIKKSIFDKAVEEIKEWKKTEEPIEREEEGIVCNLYSILQR